ncbi:MAG: phosphoglycerate mutase [Acidobacteria bacterium]|jgi:broad specificity phosphatase PhoE|nr:phosphoglycerate mutase [Acidobacteriota bacterium]MBQ02202.1 phosphoglycerate mutase [Acidobacteriota bacterium]MDP7478112.1 histidine phosphatase family protein [Vicinamibacterales bacterium]MDP7691124.1 histidine phosphatase family protein [Vicinamibacterales bacterium]HJN44083.1 histidine phosphatase family protein [Vicinamibacterales bacterium]|tara:strand:- start:757 stop:1335 length:579 start_codon:yes stop_codon:yes gene_type:complete
MIYLIRHGQTAGNAERVVQAPDTPLSAHGSRQAERLGARLADAGLTRIIASDYPRARQTAAALAPDRTVPLEVTPLLRERDLGQLRGRPYAEVEHQFYGPEHDPPGGETWDLFRERVAAAWAHIGASADAGSATVAVVTHGLVCRALAEFHLALEPGESAPAWFPNASVTHIDPTPPWTLRLAASVSHLADL